MRSRTSGRTWKVVAALALVGLLAGCGTSKSDGDAGGTTAAPNGKAATGDASEFVKLSGVPGVSDDKITYSLLATASAANPTGSCYLECFADGVNAYFAYRNDEGGVYGRDLEMAKPINDEVGNGQQRALEIANAGDTFGTFAAVLVPSAYPPLTKAGIPVYTYLTAPEQAAAPNVFGSPPTSCVVCTRIDQAFVAKVVGAKKVAALGYAVDSSAACAQSVNDTIKLYSDDIGGTKVVYKNVSVPFGMSNGLGPEVTAMKDAGVDLVFTCFDQNGTKALADEMHRQGLNVPFVENESYDSDFIAKNAKSFEGSFVTSTIRPSEAETAGTDRALYEKWMDKVGAKERTGISAHAWVLARLAYEGLLAAGPKFDQASVIDATNTIENFTAGGMLTVPWDVGRQHETPTPDDQDTHGAVPFCFTLLQFSDGKPNFLAPSTAAKPSLCWKSRGGPYADPVARNIK